MAIFGSFEIGVDLGLGLGVVSWRTSALVGR